jgi:hypothetical protein
MGIIDSMLACAADSGSDTRLRDEIAGHVAAVNASAARGDRNQVRRCELAIRSDPGAAFTIHAKGGATLDVGQRSWHAGHFETISIASLRDRACLQRNGQNRPRVSFWVFDDASPVMDIGALQAMDGNGTLFQVASQFNCLESPGPYVVPVADYFSDPTQGPRASISAFPATLLRHNSAPHGTGARIVQETDGPQIDLLSDVTDFSFSRNGYVTGHGIGEPGMLSDALEARFDAIHVGVHDDVEVALGYDFGGYVAPSGGSRIAQVFTSTAADGLYGGERNLGNSFVPVCRHLLRAAYLGTLLAAASLGRKRVVLTLIGGGVFENPVSLIWEAIQWAMEEAESCIAQDLDVIVNGFHLSTRIDLETMILPPVRRRGGAVLELNAEGLTAVRR